MIFAAVYLLWAVQRAFTGEPQGENVGLRDISLRELATVVPLLGLSLFLGFYPKPVLDRVKPAVDDLVTHVQQTHRLPRADVSTHGRGASGRRRREPASRAEQRADASRSRSRRSTGSRSRPS